MTTLSSYAKVLAIHGGEAQPVRLRRHVHVHDRPLVLVPLTMAGEANAPLACMVGTDRDEPRVLIVTQPRVRSRRFGFVAELASHIMPYLRSFTDHHEATGKRDGSPRFADAPQIWVPNSAGTRYLALLGRSTRFRRSDGDFPVAPSVPTLGKWLTFLAEQAEYADCSLMLAANHVLTSHWATGQSAEADANLASVIAWIEPWDGLIPAKAAEQAANPTQIPPAGPSTDRTFDDQVLAKLLADYDTAEPGTALQHGFERQLRTALTEQMEPTWRFVWQSIDIARRLEPGRHVASRWDRDKDTFSHYVEYLHTDGRPQARRDSAVSSARRLNHMERRQARFESDCALDDPLAMAEVRFRGEAFTGAVTTTDPTRVVPPDPPGKRGKLRPLVTIATTDPVKLAAGDKLHSTTTPKQDACIVEILDTSQDSNVVVELQSGMGHSLTPRPGSVPAVGDMVTYQLKLGYSPSGEFPERDQTPWTHGGPPDPVADDSTEDAREEWS